MFQFLTTAVLNWFDSGCCDVRYLDEWSNTPRSYTPGQLLDDSWHRDRYESILLNDRNGRYFETAVHLLMRYQFYPPEIMAHVSHFSLQERWMTPGDRIVQRIHVLDVLGKTVVDVLGMTEIADVQIEPHRCGFTYVTIATHVEEGEWSAWVSWRANGDVVLTVEAISRPSPKEPKRNYGVMRAFQQKAHQAGLAHFKQLVIRGGE